MYIIYKSLYCIKYERLEKKRPTKYHFEQSSAYAPYYYTNLVSYVGLNLFQPNENNLK